MALFENFPYTNLHNLNLDWIIEQINMVKESVVLSVNGQTGEVILYQNPWVRFPDVTTDDWTIVRNTDGVQRGIYFANDNKIYVMHGSTMSKIYTVSDPPPYPVTSVNGQTGNVILYTDAQVRLPNLTDAQLTNWNLFRHLNGVVRGIQFNDDGTAVIINDITRDPIYTAGNPPPYPVTSVNGQTGAITLYTDASMQLPTVASGTSWEIYRTVNGTNVGLKFYTDGTTSIMNGNDEYPVYIQGINDPSDFTDPEDAVLELTEPVTSGNTWGITRDINNDIVGIVFVYDSVNQEYNAYIKVGSTTQKLLTAQDIPSSSGVVSFNGQTGVVTATGSDLDSSSTDTTSIATKLAGLALVDSYIKESVAYLEYDATATHNIPERQYVIWNNAAYISTQAIAIGDTLGATNLTAITNGITNDMRNYYSNYFSTRFGGLKFSSASIPAYGSRTLTVANDTRAAIFSEGGSANVMDVIIVSCSGSGVVTHKEIFGASGQTITTGTNTLTITNTNGVGTGLYIFMFTGGSSIT